MSVIGLLRVSTDAADCGLPARSLFDQRDINACVSCALTVCLEARDETTPALSAMFHFFNVAAQFPNTADDGMLPWTGYDSLQRYGICSFSLFPLPFLRSNLISVHAPASAANTDALARRPQQNDRGESQFRRLSIGFAASSEWKTALARRQPILLIFDTNQAYWAMNNKDRPDDQIVDTWSSSDADLGSQLHAVAILGSSASEQAFVVQDSRGPRFGRGGQWYFPWNLTDGSAVHEAYTFEYP